jgi:3D (Asp-Asp-Asp) domain-containing protein
LRKCIALAGLALLGAVGLSGCSLAVPTDPCVIEMAGQQIDVCQEPDTGPTDSIEVLITYYTCEDGFCGSTASGTRVHPGTASCDPAWMGRSFVIVNDPNELTYSCENTGGAVRGNHVDIWFATHREGRQLIAAAGERATIEFR